MVSTDHENLASATTGSTCFVLSAKRRGTTFTVWYRILMIDSRDILEDQQRANRDHNLALARKRRSEGKIDQAKRHAALARHWNKSLVLVMRGRHN